MATGIVQLRKKPVTITGIYYLPDASNRKDVEAFLGDAYKPLPDHGHAIPIGTLEGTMLCAPGTWAVCGVKGEKYSIRHDILSETYEVLGAVETPPANAAEALVDKHFPGSKL